METEMTYVKQIGKLKRVAKLTIWGWGVSCFIKDDPMDGKLIHTDYRNFRNSKISPTIETTINRALSYYKMKDAELINAKKL